MVLGSDLQSEPVTAKTREDVQVSVKHVLHGGLAIGEEEIHAFTGESTPAESRRSSVADAHKVGSGLRV